MSRMFLHQLRVGSRIACGLGLWLRHTITVLVDVVAFSSDGRLHLLIALTVSQVDRFGLLVRLNV